MTTKEIKWDCLTPNEAETLATLEKSGKQVYIAPIEIEHSEQLASLGITWKEVRTWRIGSDVVKIHPTPSDKDTAKLLLNDLRTRHRNNFRANRCLVPGKRKNLIVCPEYNRCAECPYPEYRDRHKAQELSWDTLIECGYEEVRQEDEVAKLETRMELDAVLKVIDAKNPKYTKSIVLKEYYGLTVSEIAKMMNETERNIYFYLAEAKKIGAKFKRDNQ